MQTEETAPNERRCPRCSSVVPGEARFCGFCGLEVAPPGAAPAISATPMIPMAPVTPTAPVAPMEQPPAPPVTPQSVAPAPPPAAAPLDAGDVGASAVDAATPAGPMDARDAPGAAGARATPADGRVCTWCGVASDPNAGPRCPACGAVFPTPEGDAALERASLARIQAMESGMKPQRSAEQRSSWWPFRSR